MKRAPKAMPALLVAFALNACAQPPAPSSNAAPEVSLAGKKLVLVNHEGRCALRKADASLLQLEMPWPCQLSPERDGGKPRVEQFNGAQIIIVSHVQPDPSQPGRCESQYQAVRHLVQVGPPVGNRSTALLLQAQPQFLYHVFSLGRVAIRTTIVATVPTGGRKGLVMVTVTTASGEHSKVFMVK